MKKSHNYALARDLILKFIVDNGYKPGDKLPSQDSLSKTLKIGRISIQQACVMLKSEGVLENFRGSGCYVKVLPDLRALLSKPESAGRKKIFAVAPSSAPIVPHNKVLIRFGMSPGEIEFFGAQWKWSALQFQKENTGIHIEIVEIHDPAEARSLLAEGRLDVFQIPLDRLQAYVESGYLFQPDRAGRLEFPEEDFFSPIYRAANCNGSVWGVPLAANANCLFYGPSFGKLADLLSQSESLWDFLESLEELGKPAGGAESFIANDFLLTDFLALCPECFEKGEISYDDLPSTPGFSKLARRFGKYYGNRNIFHPSVNEGSYIAMPFLMKGRSAMSFGSSAWIPDFQQKGWGIAPIPAARGGGANINAVLNVISSFTSFPVESLRLLNYLADFEVQKFFAEHGRCVCHRRACERLKIRDLDSHSCSNLVGLFENGRIISRKGLFDNDFNRVLYSEMANWRSGVCTTEEFIDIVRIKKELYDNAAERRKRFKANCGMNFEQFFPQMPATPSKGQSQISRYGKTPR